MIHTQPSTLANKRIKIKKSVNDIGGKEILIEDWWDRVYGKSWIQSNGNPACLNYAIRTGVSRSLNIPTDNEVLYGKIEGVGHLVHINELDS